MAVQRGRITVIPPQGETVVVDILASDVSIGTAYAEKTGTRQLTLPLTLTERTSFYPPSSGAPYTVSVKLNGVEIAGAGGTTVTASSFPTEVVATLDVAELGTIENGGSSALPRPDARSAVAATVALGSLPGAYPGEVGLTFTLAGSVVGSSGDEDDRFATGDSGNALMVPADDWVQVLIKDLEVSSPGAVPRLRMNTAGLFSDQCLHPLEIGADLYRFDGVLWDGFPAAWASGSTTGLYLILANVGEGVALSGNLYVYFNTLSPAA